jgi:sec-independent protein translocase protein TatC
MALLKNRKSSPPGPPDGQMELMEHLTELRTRILRCLLYVAAGMVLTYSFFGQIYSLLAYPVMPVMAKTGGQFMFTGVQDAFLLQMQVCLISGLAVALPLVTLEMWGFIEPALTPEERKPVQYLAPFSVLLFIAGLATGYSCLPATFGWMSGYIGNVPGAALMQQAQQYILLTVKIVLAFGIAFQLPLILLFLARIGIITASLMTTYWRHATVGISVLAAVLTPSNDPLTMLMMAVPMAGLYLLSIGLVRAFEPKPDGTRSIALGPMLMVALAPVAIIAAAGFWMFKTSPSGRAAATPDGRPAAVNASQNAAELRSIQQEIQRLKQRMDALESRRP